MRSFIAPCEYLPHKSLVCECAWGETSSHDDYYLNASTALVSIASGLGGRQEGGRACMLLHGQSPRPWRRSCTLAKSWCGDDEGMPGHACLGCLCMLLPVRGWMATQTHHKSGAASQ